MISLKCVNEEMLSYVPYGAPSYGAYGGQTYNPKYYEYYTHPNNCNGRMGSGAGYGCNLLKYNTLPTQYYKGGDGALILYY